MLDAEIAAILLNRRGLDGQAARELLHEGNLHFIAESGGLGPASASERASMRVECLLFADGSRAFRVGASDAERRWSRWTVIEPFASVAPTPDGANDEACDAAHRRFA
ncbi:MAG TPA: hypothetical protein VL689_12430 [Paraburkholderia sp.]|jgi:hypothetical protein|nr:hypothetical protein [Paraburkholderia sp.]